MVLHSKIEGQGMPLLILHGFLGMSDNWKTLGTKFAEAGYQAHMIDLRNHGRSFHSEEFNYDAMAADLKIYCEHHALTKIHVLGHSMGGKVAMFFAMKFPDLVEKLVIADIGTKYYKPHHQDILAALNAVDFERKPERSDVEVMMQPHVADLGTRQFLMKSLYRKHDGQLGFRFNLDVFNRKIDQVGEAFPEGAVVDKPTLFLRGANSQYIRDEQIPEIQKHFPMAAFSVIANAGHWLHAENPDQVYDEVIAFLKA